MQDTAIISKAWLGWQPRLTINPCFLHQTATEQDAATQAKEAEAAVGDAADCNDDEEEEEVEEDPRLAFLWPHPQQLIYRGGDRFMLSQDFTVQLAAIPQSGTRTRILCILSANPISDCHNRYPIFILRWLMQENVDILVCHANHLRDLWCVLVMLYFLIVYTLHIL